MSKFRQAAVLVAALVCCTNRATPAENGPIGAPAFRIGDPINVVFRYDGGIEGWDGAIYVGELHGAPSLGISNGAMFVLTRGSGDFVPEQPDSLGRLQSWQVLEAKHGRLVPPIVQAQVDRYWSQLAYPQSFVTIANLAQFYKIDTPGTYWVYWGMKDLWVDEFSFEVLEAK